MDTFHYGLLIIAISNGYCRYQYYHYVSLLLGRIACMAHVRPIATDIARSVVCVTVCGLGTRMDCVKAAAPIDMPFGRLTHVSVRNHVLDEV